MNLPWRCYAAENFVVLAISNDYIFYYYSESMVTFDDFDEDGKGTVKR